MTSSVHNLGPLTTTFTPPSECSTAALSTHDEYLGYAGYWGLECKDAGDRTDIPDVSSCYPEGWQADVDFGVFSPGSICPSGWHSACSIERSDGLIKTPMVSEGTLQMWDALEVGQTAIGCCPEDFVCHTRVGDWCTSSGAIGEVITAMGTECDYTPAHITVVSEKEYNDVRASRIVLIQTAGSEPPRSAAGDGNGDTGGGGLATQTKIAIGLSVPLALLIAGIAGFLIWTRRKRKHKPSASSSDCPSSANPHGHFKSELEGMHGQEQSHGERKADQWQSPEPGTTAGATRGELATDSKDLVLNYSTPDKETRPTVHEMRGSEPLAAELAAGDEPTRSI